MESELSRIVDALPGLVWTALPDGHIDFLNQRWCEYTGLSLEEARGCGWQAAIHPEDLPQLLECWRSVLDFWRADVRWKRACGVSMESIAGSSSVLSPLRDASGQIVKWCGMSTDIEDRRRAEEALHARADALSLVADSIPALIAFLTPAGEVESVNHLSWNTSARRSRN